MGATVRNYYRLSRINIPATMPSTASPVVTVEEVLMLSKGKSPVRINQRPSKSIPRFLPAKLFVNVMAFLPLDACGREDERLISQRGIGLIENAEFANRKTPRYVRGMSAIGFSPSSPSELDQLREAYHSLNDITRNLASAQSVGPRAFRNYACRCCDVSHIENPVAVPARIVIPEVGAKSSRRT
jgi:hypothetical protein